MILPHLWDQPVLFLNYFILFEHVQGETLSVRERVGLCCAHTAVSERSFQLPATSPS